MGLVDFVAVPNRIAIVRCTRPVMMRLPALDLADDEEPGIPGLLPFAPGPHPVDDNPHYVWVLVGARAHGREQVWVRYAVERAPEGMDVRRATPPSLRSPGVALVGPAIRQPWGDHLETGNEVTAGDGNWTAATPSDSRRGQRAIVASEKDLPVFLLPKDVAVILRTTVKAVYARVERGLLPGVIRDGTRILFDRDVLLRGLRGRGR